MRKAKKMNLPTAADYAAHERSFGINEAMRTAGGKKFLVIGRYKIEVETYRDASLTFCVFRDKLGEGASNTPQAYIVDDTGVIAHVSYNGRVWEGHPTKWNSETKEIK